LKSPFASIALTLFVGFLEAHLVCEKLKCLYAGGDDLTGTLHQFLLSLSITFCCSLSQN